MKQGTAVFESVMSVLNSRGVADQISAETPAKVLLTDEEKAFIREQLVSGFEAGEIGMSEAAKAKYLDGDGNLNSYVSGLLNNWLNKDPKLNGGVKYVAKNPGSRAGQSDKKLSELKKLMKIVEVQNPSAIPAVQAKIDERLQEIAAEKTKTITVNLDLIPEELRDLVSGAAE
jgi:hypothetical protein